MRGKKYSAFYKSVLDENELDMLAKSARILSTHHYSKEEIALLSEAFSFQLVLINSVKDLSETTHKNSHLVIK